jgi:hypothetical protein
MCHSSTCEHRNEKCTKKGSSCFAYNCWTECKGPEVELPPHEFSPAVKKFFEENRPHWVQPVGGWVRSETGWVHADWVRSDAPTSVESQWVDDDTIAKPLSNLEKRLVLMLKNGALLASAKPEKAPAMKINLERSGRAPVLSLAPTPVPNMPGIRVWVSSAAEILNATGMAVEPYPDDPNRVNNYGWNSTTVYIRFRQEGKLSNAGAGYWLAPSLSHLVTSLYVGLSFSDLRQDESVDVGLIKGERTCITMPCCYSARVSPDATTWSCKKGNIDFSAAPALSFRLGDLGVGTPEWVAATKNGVGMNSLSQGAGVGHSRLLVIMTELLATHVLRLINTL